MLSFSLPDALEGPAQIPSPRAFPDDPATTATSSNRSVSFPTTVPTSAPLSWGFCCPLTIALSTLTISEHPVCMWGCVCWLSVVDKANNP